MEIAWIPMKDGVRLAATLYLPDGAKPDEKFPALLQGIQPPPRHRLVIALNTAKGVAGMSM